MDRPRETGSLSQKVWDVWNSTEVARPETPPRRKSVSQVPSLLCPLKIEGSLHIQVRCFLEVFDLRCLPAPGDGAL